MINSVSCVQPSVSSKSKQNVAFGQTLYINPKALKDFTPITLNLEPKQEGQLLEKILEKFTGGHFVKNRVENTFSALDGLELGKYKHFTLGGTLRLSKNTPGADCFIISPNDMPAENKKMYNHLISFFEG